MFQPFFDFKTINIFSKNYNIVQKFGADMKFIEEAYGLCGANGSFSCIYCEEDIKKRWEAGDQNRILKINRKLERSRFVCSQNFKNSKKKLGSADSPPKKLMWESYNCFIFYNVFLAKMRLLDVCYAHFRCKFKYFNNIINTHKQVLFPVLCFPSYCIFCVLFCKMQYVDVHILKEF